MKIAFFAWNPNFCGSILEELRNHHQVKVWKPRGFAKRSTPPPLRKDAKWFAPEGFEFANITGLINWCDVIYCDFIQRPCLEISQLQWLDKPMVVRMDGIDIMNHININWEKVFALILMPVQEKRLMRLRKEWEKTDMKLIELPKKILRRNIGIDLTLFNYNRLETPIVFGTGPEILEKSRVSSGYKIIYHTNVMRSVKNPYIILQCFRELLNRDDKPWHLTFIGDWEKGWETMARAEYVMCLRELREEIEIPEKSIDFIPNAPRNTWAQALPSYNVIWGYSHREGFPNSIGEACASGVYPIMNHFYGAETIYPDQYLVQSPLGLVEKTIAWGNMTEEEKLNAKHAVRHHIEQYDRHKVAREIRELCEEALR